MMGESGCNRSARPDRRHPTHLRHLPLWGPATAHTSGLTYAGSGTYPRGLAGPLMPLDEVMARIAAVNGSDVAGAVAHYVTGPLGMVDTMFGVTDAARLPQPYRDGLVRERLAPIRMAGEGTLAGTPCAVFGQGDASGGSIWQGAIAWWLYRAADCVYGGQRRPKDSGVCSARRPADNGE